ncbi:TPA: hypothetical protein ACNB31_003693 [Escherichia coli]
MYEYFTDGTLTGCTYTPESGVQYTGMVVTNEYVSDEIAQDAAKLKAELLSSG